MGEKKYYSSWNEDKENKTDGKIVVSIAIT